MQASAALSNAATGTGRIEVVPAAPRMTLYDVGMEGVIIADILTESEGELTPELEQRLDELMRQGPERVEAAAMVLRQIEADASACDTEITRLKQRKESFERQAENLKKRMVFAVDAAFSGKVKTARFSIWTQKSADGLSVALAEGFTPEMVREDHPELVKTEYRLDNAAARELWARHSEAIKDARAVLADLGSTDEQREQAHQVLALIPECLSIEERKGTRYLRVK